MAGWKEVIFKSSTAADLGLVGAAQGNLLVADASSVYVNFTAGASGKVLTSAGAAATPTWETPCPKVALEEGSLLVSASTPFAYAELAHGTNGQVLQSGGHGAQPSWTAGGGDFKADGTVPMTGNLDFANNAAKDMKLHTTVPGTPADGHIYFDTTADKVKVYVA